MLARCQYSPVTLNEREQVVLAVESRVFPTLTETILIFLFAPALLLLPLVVLHRLFRPMTYLITTERILIVEPKRVLAEIDLGQISKTKSTKTSLMVYAGKRYLWLSRIPDAWFLRQSFGECLTRLTTPAFDTLATDRNPLSRHQRETLLRQVSF